MRHGAELTFAHFTQSHSVLANVLEKHGLTFTRFPQPEDHHVCGDTLDVHLEFIDGGKSQSKPAGESVVFRETVDVISQRVYSRGSQNAGLAHSSAQKLSPASDGSDTV